MKRTILLVIGVFLLISGLSHAVEATYFGPHGNPEEPALRPYKWIWHGVKALLYQPARSFQHGNMKTPVLGTVEVGRGLRRGTVEMLESVCRGAVFAAIPEAHAAKDLGAANQQIEEDPVLYNVADFGFTAPAFPILKVCVDKYPMQSEEKVQRRLEESRQARQEREASREGRAAAEKQEKARPPETNEKTQKGSRQMRRSPENLLRLAN